MTFRLPPVLMLLLFVLAAWLLKRLLPDLSLGASAAGNIAGALLIATGGTLLLAALLAFRKAATTVNPLYPEHAKSLVTTGLYRFTRNPMYLAFALILTGVVLVLDNALALIAPVLFIPAMTLLQIRPEEAVLRQKFGRNYEAYCRQTRRWL